jgi:tetratricopeptide (TPR) repeat protein
MYLMKNQLINIFLFFFLNTCFAQVNVDSLRAVWNDQNQADTTRLNSIDNLIFSHYLMTNSDSTNFYAQKMFVFATEKGLKKYQANAFHNMGNYEQGNGNEPEALKYFERSLTLRQEIGDKRGIGRSLANMAIIYHNKGDILKGLDNYEKALSYFEEIDDKDLIGFVLTYIGGAYADLGNYTKAIEYTLRSMSVTEDSDNDYMRMNTLLSMGGLYWNLDNFTQSKEYYQQSQILAKKINSITGQNAALFALAEILIEEEDYNGALAYGDEILLLNEKVDNPYVTHGLYYLKGRIYQLKGNFEKALDYYEKCLKYFESIDRNYDIVWVKTYMGQVYLEKKDGKNAIKWCKEALFLAEDMKKMDHQVDACECLYKAHKMLNQSSQALAYHERFLILNDSLHKDETGKKLQQMEFDRRQLVDSLAQVKKDRIVQVLHEQEVQKKNQEKNFFLLIGVLVLLLAAGLYHRLRFVRKSREKLNIEKNRAEKSEQIKQDFLANMSHEIRTPMNAVMGMTDLALDMPLGDKQRYYLNGIKKAGDNLLHIINDILDLSKMEAGKMELDAIDFSIRDTVEQVKQMLQHRAKDKDLELLTLVESEVDDVVVGDPMRLNQVLINLMGNAIKFTLKGSVTL